MGKNVKKINWNGKRVKVNPRCEDCKKKCKEPYFNKIIRCYLDEDK